MVPFPKTSNSIDHFTHPGHKLVELKAQTEYLCNGCKTLGTGTRFRCNNCDFDLHEYCGKCPATLSSFIHPPHPLTLVLRKAQGTRTNDRICDVCRDSVEGLFYRCKECEFDVHPLCTQLPRSLRHAVHPSHPLMLQMSKNIGFCVVCGGVCNSWRYRCGDCGGYDVHLECVLVSCDTSNNTSTRQVPNPPPPPPPPHGGYAYNGMPFGSGTYYNMYNAGYSCNHGVYNYANQAGEGGGGARNGMRRKFMYGIVTKLAAGVVTNVIFGIAGGVDFSSFM